MEADSVTSPQIKADSLKECPRRRQRRWSNCDCRCLNSTLRPHFIEFPFQSLLKIWPTSVKVTRTWMDLSLGYPTIIILFRWCFLNVVGWCCLVKSVWGEKVLPDSLMFRSLLPLLCIGRGTDVFLVLIDSFSSAASLECNLIRYESLVSVR